MTKVPTLEELNKLYKNLGGKGEVAKGKGSVAKKEKATVKPPPVVEGTETQVEDQYAYCDVHFWMRSTDNWNQVILDARSEVSVRGSSVLVFAHNHQRNSSCNHLCRQVKGE